METRIKTENLAVGYGRKILIGDISIDIEGGSIVTLIGANGSGKSTILRTLARSIPNIGGDVFIDGKNLSGIKRGELAKKMAVMDTSGVKTELADCLEIVLAGRYRYTGMMGISSGRDREIALECIHMVDADELVHADFERISDGQRQKILLARALCQEPEIILMDEPTSYLDIKHKIELMELLTELKEKKKLTVLMSLHELGLAAGVSDRLICIKDFAVDRVGSPKSILTSDYIEELFSMDEGSWKKWNEWRN